MSNSSPYELRASLLSQANEILNHIYHTKVEELRFKIEKNLIGPDSSWPEAPTSDDIIKEAEKLYTFVQTK